MGHPWEAETKIEPALALELIQRQFPELHAKEIRLLGAGWDNTAFIVNERWIFRFPRREIAVPLLETEWALLPKLAERLPLPIPFPKWRGIPTADFRYPFVGYQILPGVTACYAHLSEIEREALAEPLAKFLSVLHTLPVELLSGHPIFGDNQSRIDCKKLVPKSLESIKQLVELGLLKHPKRLEAVVERFSNLRPPMTGSVVHGDFYARHIVVNEHHHLAGVIDWGDLHIGDPAIDLAIAHSFLPRKAHEIFRKSYGAISEETWNLAHLRAIYSSSLIVLFGYHSNDSDLVNEGLRILND